MSSWEVILPLLFIWGVTCQEDGLFENPNFKVKLTGERGGPPQNAQFVPIGVVDLPVFSQRPSSKKPLKGGHPPPPPPPSSLQVTKPTKRPKPSGPVAPPPPPVPLPVDQGIPQGTVSSGTVDVPALPPNVVMVTPLTEIRPDQETVVTPPPTRPTTTPNTNDALPALSQRFNLADDGSYYFDFQAANSINRQEQGFFKRDSSLEYPIHVKTGTWSYISPEGIPFRVDFVADERGFRTFTRQAN